jgi:hypothetical protein
MPTRCLSNCGVLSASQDPESSFRGVLSEVVLAIFMAGNCTPGGPLWTPIDNLGRRMTVLAECYGGVLTVL